MFFRRPPVVTNPGLSQQGCQLAFWPWPDGYAQASPRAHFPAESPLHHLLGSYSQAARHGLVVTKVPHLRLYRVKAHGHQVMTAALAVQDNAFPDAYSRAAQLLPKTA